MSIAAVDIDAIVRQIMADMGAGESSLSSSQPLPPKKAVDKSKLCLLDSLVTLASLEGRLDGVREVVITPKAVVTPSVRDLLYRKDIRIAQRQTPENTASNTATDISSKSIAGQTPVWVGLHDLKREPETLLQFLQGHAAFVKAAFACVVETVETAAELLAGSQTDIAIIVTNHAAAAAVLANRYAAVRAIVGNGPEQVTQDAAQVEANLLVLPVDRAGAYRMREIARAFLTGQRQSPVEALIKAFAERGTK